MKVTTVLIFTSIGSLIFLVASFLFVLDMNSPKPTAEQLNTVTVPTFDRIINVATDDGGAIQYGLDHTGHGVYNVWIDFSIQDGLQLVAEDEWEGEPQEYKVWEIDQVIGYLYETDVNSNIYIFQDIMD